MTNDTSHSSDDPALDDPRVRMVLAAAAAPVETAGPLPGEKVALAAFRASAQRTKRPSAFSRLVSGKAAVAAAIGTGVLLTGGVGAAAAGVLPGAAQETVSTWLETVGISVPAGQRAHENGDQPGHSEYAPGQNTDQPGHSAEAPGVRARGNGDQCGHSEQTPGERARGNGDQCGHSEQAPGVRARGNGDQCGHSAEAPGEPAHGSGNQPDHSEQAPGEPAHGNGNQPGHSEQTPGERTHGNGNQCGHSEQTPGNRPAGR